MKDTNQMTRSNTERVLAGLAQKINEEHAAAQDAQLQSLDHAIKAGERLTEAKAVVAHGQWLPWIKDNCLFSERTVQLYMRLAKHGPDLREKSATVADLSLNEAARLVQGEPREKTKGAKPFLDMTGLSEEEKARRYELLAVWHSMSDDLKKLFATMMILRQERGFSIHDSISNDAEWKKAEPHVHEYFDDGPYPSSL